MRNEKRKAQIKVIVISSRSTTAISLINTFIQNK